MKECANDKRVKGRNLCCKPLFRLNYYLQLTNFVQMVNLQSSIFCHYIDVERIARMKMLYFHHVMSSVKGRKIGGGKQRINCENALYSVSFVRINANDNSHF